MTTQKDAYIKAIDIVLEECQDLKSPLMLKLMELQFGADLTECMVSLLSESSTTVEVFDHEFEVRNAGEAFDVVQARDTLVDVIERSNARTVNVIELKCRFK